LSQYAGIGFCVYAVAKQHQRQFSTHWLNGSELQLLTSYVPVALMRDVLDHEFFRSFAEADESLHIDDSGTTRLWDAQ
jgi:hypothetical protein